MIHDQVELHNIAELVRVPGQAGLRCQRVPESVRQHLNPTAQERMLQPANCEIRFVSEGDGVRATLSCPQGTAEVIPFFGGFQDRERYSIGPEPRTVELVYPDRLRRLRPEVTAGMPFHPRVWRLTVRGDGLQWHGIEGQGLRPPRPEELPALRYLAYGTSITHGGAASAAHLTYVAQAARSLGADLTNLGAGGSAYCEPELAEYMAGRDDWDIASLCLSVNMIGAGFSPEEFGERAGHMLRTMADADPERPILCCSILPYFADVCADVEGPHGQGLAPAFRRVLEEVALGCGRLNVHFVPGTELLTDVSGHTADVLHPGDYGMMEIGQRLAAHLQGLAAASPRRRR